MGGGSFSDLDKKGTLLPVSLEPMLLPVSLEPMLLSVSLEPMLLSIESMLTVRTSQLVLAILPFILTASCSTSSKKYFGRSALKSSVSEKSSSSDWGSFCKKGDNGSIILSLINIIENIYINMRKL